MKQTIYVICESRESFMSLIGLTNILKIKDGKASTNSMQQAEWYIRESDYGKNPVKLKTDMTFEDFTLFVYAMAKSDRKLYCQDGLFVLR